MNSLDFIERSLNTDNKLKLLVRIIIHNLYILLLPVFIVLKLEGTITWSWMWVLTPVWMLIGVVLLGFLLSLTLVLSTNVINDKNEEELNIKLAKKKRRRTRRNKRGY